MNVWIQYHNFDYDYLGSISYNEAMTKYRAFDWETEILKGEQSKIEKKECCSPGMGFVSEDRRILHIVPMNKGALIHYHYPKKRRILRLFNTTTISSLSVDQFPDEGLTDLINEHYEENGSAVKELMKILGKEL